MSDNKELNRKKAKEKYDNWVKDPYADIVRNYLKETIGDKKFHEMLKGLNKYGKSYAYINSYLISIHKSSMSAKDLIKFTLATGKKEIVIKITDEQIELLEEYSRQTNLEKHAKKKKKQATKKQTSNNK